VAYDDIDSIATRMVARYGETAVKILSERSRRLLKAGYLDDAELWKRVAGAAVTLLRSQNRAHPIRHEPAPPA